MADNTQFNTGAFDITPADDYAVDQVYDWFDSPSGATERYTHPAGVDQANQVLMIVNRRTGVRSFITKFNGTPYTPSGDRTISTFKRIMGKAYSIDGRSLDQAAYYINGTITPQDCGGVTTADGCAPCEVHVYDPDGIVYTKDGTDPAGTVGAPTTGFRANEGDVIELGHPDMSIFKFNSLNPNTTTTVTGSIYVQYFSGSEGSSGFDD